ncbi:MAG: diguanylate cyclase [Clostridia bacterium]|nr:diguanylate cyclase [Clostridia bacterium]
MANLRVGVGRGYYSESVLRDELGIGTYVAYDDLESTRDEFAAANVMLQSKLAEIEDLAYVNRVTGLPNKNRFKETVENLILDPTVDHFCFLFLDLDDFKEVNEAFGHAMGDQVLQKIARRLSGVESNSQIFDPFDHRHRPFARDVREKLTKHQSKTLSPSVITVIP